MADTVMMFGTHKVRLFQRNDQPSNYWFMRVQLEGKTYKRSLKTAVLELAKERAQAEMIEVLAKIRSGQKVFSTTVREARAAYLLDQQDQITRDKRSKFTVKKVIQRIQRAMEFLIDQDIPPTASIDSIQGNLWQEYIDWRLEPMPDIRRDGIHDELTTIRAWFEWCQKKKWVSEINIPTWELKIENQQAKRVKFTPEQINKAKTLMKQWCMQAPDNSYEQTKRLMFYVVFSTMCVGAFRTGEILQVRYKDLHITETEIVVTVQEQTSKVRKTREVALVGDDAIELAEWINGQEEWKPDDMVFLLGDSSDPSKIFYQEFAKCRKAVLVPAGLGTLKVKERLEAYHARHYCITNWLMAERSIHLVSVLAGTSTGEIENTYSGVIQIVTAREFAKKKLIHKDDGSFEVLTNVAQKYKLTRTPKP